MMMNPWMGMPPLQMFAPPSQPQQQAEDDADSDSSSSSEDRHGLVNICNLPHHWILITPSYPSETHLFGPILRENVPTDRPEVLAKYGAWATTLGNWQRSFDFLFFFYPGRMIATKSTRRARRPISPTRQPTSSSCPRFVTSLDTLSGGFARNN